MIKCNRNGINKFLDDEKFIRHHTKYLECDGEDEIVMMCNSGHISIHRNKKFKDTNNLKWLYSQNVQRYHRNDDVKIVGVMPREIKGKTFIN